jgi:hypothetical protein
VTAAGIATPSAAAAATFFGLERPRVILGWHLTSNSARSPIESSDPARVVSFLR